MKDNIELWVEAINGTDETLADEALAKLDNEVRSSTSTMTSIPKPFKFLVSHFDTLEKAYKRHKENDRKVLTLINLEILCGLY